MVGQAIAEKMQQLGHSVFMGTRDATATMSRTEANPMTGTSFSEWHGNNSAVQVVNYANLPGDTDLYVNATSGSGSVDAMRNVGTDVLAGKIVMDIANPLDFSQGMPPTLTISNTDSLGELIQREFPDTHIVKALNTMNAAVMVNPSLVPGKHDVFVSGNSGDAKQAVSKLLQSMGWAAECIIDLGDISTCRGTEMILPIWIRLWGALGTPMFNFHIAK